MTSDTLSKRNKMECEICHTTLTESELSHYKYPEESVLVCEKHWCNCMPDSYL